LEFHSRLLEAASHGRRGDAAHAGPGRGKTVASGPGELLDIQRNRQPRVQWTHSQLRRTHRCRERSARPTRPTTQGSKEFHTDRQSLKRLDTPNKTDGKVVYGIDAMLPGMKFATLAQCPVFGGKVGRVDDTAAKKVPGVQQIVVLDDLVAVVGDHMWAAKKGLDALAITWNEGPNAKLNSSDIWNDLRAASKKDGVIAKSVGNVAKGLSQGDRFDGEYEMPFLAHACMEPLNCTVHVTADGCEV